MPNRLPEPLGRSYSLGYSSRPCGITTTEGRRNAARAVGMVKVASTRLAPGLWGRMGARAVAVHTDTPPLHPARIAGSHFGPPWDSLWSGVRRCATTAGRRFLSDAKLPHPDSDGNCRNSANRPPETACSAEYNFAQRMRENVVRSRDEWRVSTHCGVSRTAALE